MNKSAIQKFAIWARTELIAQVSQRAFQYGITAEDYGDANAATVNGQALTPSEQSQRRELVSEIQQKDYHQVMEEVAYTWFNRFIALRFMEVNNYLPSHIRIFSDSAGAFKPEILNDALHLELPGLDREKIAEFIEKNQTEDLYRYLLLTQCNALNEAMPRMFERMGSYTELLLPNNILKADGVLGRMVTDIPEEDWTDQVQIIGWLYQYYITELNEQVYDGTMSKSRIPKELLPAATTIYTPDWPVRYMVENSLGRLWVEGHPNDELKSGWKYYLKEAVQEPEVQAQLESIRAEYGKLNPEEIRVIDPCCGSGHILVYCFEVLMQIYESQGYTQRDAAQLIVEKNLYGLDIDNRAAQLAYFAVMMKARSYDRRFLTRQISPHIYAIQDSNGIDRYALEYFCNGDAKLKAAMDSIIKEMHDAKEYGSILSITPVDFAALYARFDQVRDDIHMGQETVLNSLLPLVQTAEVLAQKYEVVVTNPPYLGSSRFSPMLDQYIKQNYADVKSDLSMAMYKNSITGFSRKNGFIAFITTSSWMFLSSFENLRNFINDNTAISSLVDFGTELFDGKVGHNPIVAWVTMNRKINYKLKAIRLVDYCYSRRDEKEPEFFNLTNCYTAQQSNFSKIPGSPVAYWVSNGIFDAFENGKALGSMANVPKGLSTGSVDTFMRFWYEPSFTNITFDATDCKDTIKGTKWYPYAKGGAYRKWNGNLEYVVNWANNGFEVKHFVDEKGKQRSRPQNTAYYFKKCLTYSAITSYKLSLRYLDKCIFGGGGDSIHISNDSLFNYIFGFTNSILQEKLLRIISPTINFEVDHLKRLPIIIQSDKIPFINILVQDNIVKSKSDWDSFETSWNFKKHPLV